MNWKLNYWTVLFALAVAALGYHHFVGQPQPDAPVVTPDSSTFPMLLCDKDTSLCETSNEVDTIPIGTAVDRIKKHAEQMGLIQAKLDADRYPLPASNFVMTYVKLPKCELYEMLCMIPNGDVYIYPTIERDGQTDIFSIVIGDTPVHPDSIMNLDGVEDLRGAKFFDFGRPCPPCNNE